MNNVIISNVSIGEKYKLRDLILKDKDYDDRNITAFIGSIGSMKGLFLITYDRLVYAEDPQYTWDYCVDVMVEKFVDVDMVVKDNV